MKLNSVMPFYEDVKLLLALVVLYSQITTGQCVEIVNLCFQCVMKLNSVPNITALVVCHFMRM